MRNQSRLSEFSFLLTQLTYTTYKGISTLNTQMGKKSGNFSSSGFNNSSSYVITPLRIIVSLSYSVCFNGLNIKSTQRKSSVGHYFG